VNQLEKAAQMMEWSKLHVEVRDGLASTMHNRGYNSISQIADDNPILFDMLYEDFKSMLEQLPHTKGYGE
jgi:hypothetical protein